MMIMKISPAILFSWILAYVILTAFEYSGGNIENDQVQSGLTKKDTIKISDLITKDSFGLNIVKPSKGIQFYRNGIIYTSSSKNNNRMSPLFESFGVVTTSFSPLTDSIAGKPVSFAGSEIFDCPSDAVTFNNKYNIMYYSTFAKEYGTYEIFRATLSAGRRGKQGKWDFDPEPLGFCSDNAIYTHPALSADDSIMVFASDRQGSKGGLDLFMVHSSDTGWSNPVDIPGMVNSEANETYPFLDKDNNLYFSSNRQGGFGGYDIYFARFNGVTWDKPVDMPEPLNTANNDIAFKISRENGELAFYSIEPVNGNTELSTYLIKMLNPTGTETKYSDLGSAFSSILTPGRKQENIASVSSGIYTNSIHDTAKITVNSQKIQDSVLTMERVKNQNISSTVEGAVSLQDKKTVAAHRERGHPDSLKRESTQEVRIPIYRVQILSSMKPRDDKTIMIQGIEYESYEYFYKGAYRTCVGTFRSLSDAVELKSLCKKSGYQEAFVAAFVNNIRSNDISLFRK